MSMLYLSDHCAISMLTHIFHILLLINLYKLLHLISIDVHWLIAKLLYILIMLLPGLAHGNFLRSFISFQVVYHSIIIKIDWISILIYELLKFGFVAQFSWLVLNGIFSLLLLCIFTISASLITTFVAFQIKSLSWC